MRHKQHTLLAGVAAFALFVATGAFAQQGQLDQKGGAQMKAPSGMQTERSNQGGMNQGSMKQGGGKSSSSPNRSAQELNKNNRGSGTINRTAQEHQQFNAQSKATQSKNTETKTTESKNGRFAAQPENQNHRGTSTAQRNESLKGLQGNTSVPMRGAGGANVTLNEHQRTQIRGTIINGRGAPRVGSVDFDVTVGTMIPRGHLHMVRVPETLVRIDPGWRGFLYFVYNDEIIIVDPHDMRIVEVLPV